jgi:Sulfatase-modifying factor enzyme 1
VVGALIAKAGFSLDWLGESHAECLARLAGLRDPALRQAAADDRLGVAIPSLAAGFDRCQAAISAASDAECVTSFIDGVGEVPVTVREFARFVEGGGYEDERWWAGFPFAFGRWREPREWKKQISNPTNPVTGVSWYEVTAYASYLSQIEAPVWVASFAERRGVCGEPFPWGTEPATPSRLNYDQYIGGASPVGAYLLGIGLAGHADLAGNVWEWCSDLTDEESAVVCGGGWYTAAEYVKSDYRYGFHRSNRFDDLGFRIAREGSRA